MRELAERFTAIGREAVEEVTEKEGAREAGELVHRVLLKYRDRFVGGPPWSRNAPDWKRWADLYRTRAEAADQAMSALANTLDSEAAAPFMSNSL